MAIVQLSNDQLQVAIDVSHGARISSIIASGVELLVTEADDTLNWGAYPMVPYAGRVRDGVFMFQGLQYELPLRPQSSHAMHGTVLDREWTSVDSSATSASFTSDLGTDWPFAGSVTHTVSLDDGSLTSTLTLTASEPMPAQVGWHPWFRSPRNVNHHFDAMLQRDVSGLTTTQEVPVPKRKYDDCFVRPHSMPQLTIDGITIEVSSDCSHWVMYNAPDGHMCIEPQSGPPNGINTKPYTVIPSKPLERWMKIHVLS